MRIQTSIYILIAWLPLCLGGLGLVACNKATTTTSTQETPVAISVDVMKIELDALPLGQVYSGRVVATQIAQVRPQVTGIIDEVLFDEGMMVKAGQPLYRINADSYVNAVASNEAAVKQAIANIGIAQSSLAAYEAIDEQTQADLTRIDGLLQIEAVSKQAYEQALTAVKTTKAQVRQAKSTLASAQASLQTAQANLSASRLDLQHTIVRASISGRMGASSLSKGALVATGQASPLASIFVVNPVYVDIAQASLTSVFLNKPSKDEAWLIMDDGQEYPTKGRLVDLSVNQDIFARTVFANPDGDLVPGMYVGVRLNEGMAQHATWLPKTAVLQAADQPKVYLAKEGQVHEQSVKIAGEQADNWLIVDGLRTGDYVVVDATQVSSLQPIKPNIVSKDI